MILRIKASVDQQGVKPVIWFAAGIAFMVFKEEINVAARITSMVDGDPKRVSGTLHPLGLAVDFGAKKLTPEEENRVLNRLVDELEHMGFDVILHGNGVNRHFHIEYQPKGNENWQVKVKT